MAKDDKKSLLNKIASKHLNRMKENQEAPPAGADPDRDGDKHELGEAGPEQANPSVTVHIIHQPGSQAVVQGQPQNATQKAEMASQRGKGKVKK